MKLSTKQLSKILNVRYQKAYRLAMTLRFKETVEHNKLYFHFPSNHPMTLSIQASKGTPAKPIYSIAELSKLWQWRKGSYCTYRIRQLLDDRDIPVYNKSQKGYVYLVDIMKLAGQNDKYCTEYEE